MDFPDSLQLLPVTQEFVFQAFADEYHQCVDLDEADVELKLDIATSISDWRDGLMDDFFSWRSFAHAMNRIWRMDRPLAEWRNVLLPTKDRTLGDVCQFIAKHGVRPAFRAASVLGPPCESAGAFLAVRELLREDGADVSMLSPSTPLAPYTRRHASTFFERIALLKLGGLPPVEVVNRPQSILCCGTMIGLALLGLGHVFGNPWLVIGAVLFLGVGILGIWFVAFLIPPTSVSFHGLATFRDLATHLARPEEGLSDPPIATPEIVQ